MNSDYWEDDFSDHSSDIGSVRSEVRSTMPQLVSSQCYGRGKSLSDIIFPRIPRHLRNIPQKTQPTEFQSRGRGRAHVLKERIENLESSSRSSSQESLSSLLQAMDATSRPGNSAKPESSVEKTSKNIYDTLFLDLTDSATEDAEDGDTDFVVPPLPSKRNFSFRPCVPPALRKPVPNLKCMDDFPSLSGDAESTATHESDPMTESSSRTSCFEDTELPKTLDDVVPVSFVEEADLLAELPSNWTVKKSKNKSKTKQKLKKGCKKVEKSNDKKDCFSVPSGLRKVSLQGSDSTTHVATEGWVVKGDNVIQIEGLPSIGDTSNLEDLISSFGTVLNMQHRLLSDKRVIRIRYNTAEACEWAMACLHDSDCIFSDSNCVLVCSVVQD
ncbi:uncharacterized protein LOC121378595 [Gigantopelta aegis]|uniref:uncharacterized protein LOC121378595 n=1 Tax=Gigantopelta aegis TaxID=1735272 RepID=UPI001B889FEB|nr:uncharacterized protein LOC121378595 [Gigantopelta aegis]XP_041362783.1 uncharacterized protein LOC121378595 [Gigantopelta aegis]XP_041362784.1 uncharacterized protein LOC121378595 [Gigantopelta aegis]XP_041362785.1 uncharacterized protein LOC121378595 [Gigantopelta aegis]